MTNVLNSLSLYGKVVNRLGLETRRFTINDKSTDLYIKHKETSFSGWHLEFEGSELPGRSAYWVRALLLLLYALNQAETDWRKEVLIYKGITIRIESEPA